MPRCKNCKEKFEKKYPNQMGKLSYCLEKDECISEFWRVANDISWKKRKAQMKKNLKTVTDYYNEAIEAFNEYIRERDKDKPCVSCGAEAGTYTMSSGHYFPQGANKSIGLDERNAHGQCWYNCNSNKSGNLSEYLPELINRIGKDNYEDLQRLRHITKRYTRQELEEITKQYKQKLKELRNDKL